MGGIAVDRAKDLQALAGEVETGGLWPVRNMPVPAQLIDHKERLLEVSDAWLALTGYRREEVLGRLASSLLSLESARVAALDVIPDLRFRLRADQVVLQVKAADGLVFVTPEYNYSVPGLLKNAIDWASRPAFESPFVGKRCFVITTSGGALGGVRAQAHLKYILNGMLAVVFPWKEIVVTHANRKVEDGWMTDTEVLDFAQSAIEALIASVEGGAD